MGVYGVFAHGGVPAPFVRFSYQTPTAIRVKEHPTAEWARRHSRVLIGSADLCIISDLPD